MDFLERGEEGRGRGKTKRRELARVNLLECGGRRVKEGNENWSLSLRVFGFLSVQSAGVLAFISGGIKWYKGLGRVEILNLTHCQLRGSIV